METINPKQDYLTVRKLELPDKMTKSGIILPGQKEYKLVLGEVVAAGPGHYENGHLIPNDFKRGDKIIFQDQVGIPVDFGEHLLVVKGCYVLGTIDLPEGDVDISPAGIERSRIASENLGRAMKHPQKYA
jgi:co-chaperonin GroES (HSP10)